MADKLPPMNLPGPAIPYMRALEKMLTDVQNQQTRTSESLTNIRTSAMRAGSAVDLASARLGDLSRTVTEIPLSPTGVQGTQRWDWDLQGHASSAMDVSWDIVTSSGTGAKVNVTTYQVWVREQNTTNLQRVLAVGALSATVTGLKVNTGYYVSISAVTASGTMGGLSTEVYVAPPAPMQKLTPPTPPGLASDYGVVAVAWDGLLTGPDAIPSYFAYVRAFISENTTGPWSPVGPSFTHAGSTTVADLPVDSTRYFKFVAYDRVGGNSDDSTVTSIVVKGVDLGTLNTDISNLQTQLDANDAALATAQGNINTALTGPVDGVRLVAGSVTTGAVAAGSITSAQIAAGTITASNIGAGQITALNIGAGQVQANHIAAGSIDANKIAAGAIQVSHLSPSVGGSIDISANNSINMLVGNINDQANDIDSVSGTVDTMSTYYQFGPDGATITAPNSPFAVGIRNDRIDMLQQGVAVSSWNAGQMFVNSFVGTEVVLGNHKIEKYGTGTVVRSL